MMNGRHLPAGQAMQPDMGRRRQQYHANQHQHQQYPHPQQQYSPGTPMYNNNGYIQPYSNPYYSQHMPQQYHNPIPPHQYAQYQPYGRSPPPPMHQQYTPIPQYSNSPSVTRPQQSPAIVSTPYHPPPPPQTQPVTQAPPPPPVQTTPSIQAPSSTQSSHTLPVPLTPPTPQLSTAPPPSPPVAVPAVPFRAPLPWFSRPDLPWPERHSRKKKRRAPIKGNMELHPTPRAAEASKEKDSEPSSTEPAVARPETPSTNRPLSEETDSTTPTTPSSYVQTSVPAGDATPHGDTTPIAPKPRSSLSAVPIIPALPKTLSPTSQKTTEPPKSQETPSKSVDKENVQPANSVAEPIISEEVKPASPAVKVAPKSWAALLQSPAAASTGAPSDVAPGAIGNTGFAKNAESLAEALRSFNAESTGSKVAFLKPRGLVNTGNMCYMNSVLQVLVFCLPFYDFLDQVGKRAVHSFKSDTPLIDAMIMFMREFPVIDSAISVDQLRLRLKDGELEQYGEAFSPDFVYNVINKLPRFSSMRRGHQQDAEEFLGFLLEGLHDECVQVMRASSASNGTSAATTPMNGPSSPASERGSTTGSIAGDTNGWLEVGPKQKAAVTRSSGTIITGSPVTKIFGGNLRSELRVPGLKDSVTLEPYQPLQLDIGSPNVNNIVDALKGLTGSEALHGDFKSPKGPNVTATKQVFIETVPPVLILHLKRFQYDNAGGTQKIWKKIGYPLELEIPKEVFPRQKRSVYAHGGLPKYRLIAVVYHHGNNASGGHYTVDVRRQDGREWIRLDDTVIRRVRSEDVAEGGSEEDPKVLATALEAHKKDTPTSSNPFATIDDDAEGEDGWKQVNGPSSGAASGGKKWSSVVNGASTPKSKSDKFSVKDNKVAYLLFYQKI